jgi:hypothetical protein
MIELETQIKQLIEEDKIDEAIGLMKNFGSKAQKKSILLISSKFVELKNEKRIGLLTLERFSVEKSQIRKGIIELVEQTNSPEKNTKNPIVILGIIIFVVICLISGYYFLINPEKSIPLENIRLIYSAESEKQILDDDDANNELKIVKLLQGEANDKSLIFEILLRNDSEKPIYPDNFHVEYIFNSEKIGISGPLSSNFILPIAKYHQIIQIPLSDTKRPVLRKSVLQIHPIMQIKPGETVSVIYQLSYELEEEWMQGTTWDLFFH